MTPQMIQQILVWFKIIKIEATAYTWFIFGLCFAILGLWGRSQESIELHEIGIAA